MLQTAKTPFTKHVEYIEWIVDQLCGHQLSPDLVLKWPKKIFWPSPPFLTMRGPRGPRCLAKVEQMVDHTRTHAGVLP